MFLIKYLFATKSKELQLKMQKSTFNYNKIITSTSKNTVAGMA